MFKKKETSNFWSRVTLPEFALPGSRFPFCFRAGTRQTSAQKVNPGTRQKLSSESELLTQKVITGTRQKSTSGTNTGRVTSYLGFRYRILRKILKVTRNVFFI